VLPSTSTTTVRYYRQKQATKPTVRRRFRASIGTRALASVPTGTVSAATMPTGTDARSSTARPLDAHQRQAILRHVVTEVLYDAAGEDIKDARAHASAPDDIVWLLLLTGFSFYAIAWTTS